MSQEEIGQGHHKAMEIRLEGYKAILEQVPSRKEDVINPVMFRVYNSAMRLIVSGVVNPGGGTSCVSSGGFVDFPSYQEILDLGSISMAIHTTAMGWMT